MKRKKIIVSGVVLSVFIGLAMIGMAVPGDKPEGQPFDAIWDAITDIQNQIGTGNDADWVISDEDIWSSGSGTVGIGTNGPAAKKLEVLGDAMFTNSEDNTYFFIEQEGAGIKSIGAYQQVDENTAYWRTLQIDGDEIHLNTFSNGNVGIGTTTSPQGKLDVNGTIYQRGSELHADYVFEPDYELESIEEHADFMWKEKHLKAIPKAKVDENGKEIIEVGSHRKGIVEELEKAHIYIEKLHKHIDTLEEANKELDQRLARLEAKLNE